MDILDSLTTLKQRDTKDALGLAAGEPKQLSAALTPENMPKKIPAVTGVVVAGMGGSALAAEIARDWLDLPIPFVVVKDYHLPNWVNKQTLVIACSFSGNTEETLSAFEDARERGCPLVIAAAGGTLMEQALKHKLPFVHMEYDGTTPRMFVLENLRAFVEILAAYDIVSSTVPGELTTAGKALAKLDEQWGPKVPFDKNIAKQLAWHCAGKIPVFYSGPRFRSIAYKWKISINESSKNIAFHNELPEFNHNEFQGWASHPIEKPFAVFDIRTSYDHERVTKRFEISDKLLSGLRPKATVLQLEGDTMLEQMSWGVILADYVSTYLGILNGVDPAPVPLIEKLKNELRKP